MSEKYSVVILSNMCMVEDGKGNILVQDRAKKDWPGLTFPGGHVEPNESLTEAVIREVKEETGLDISSPLLCGVMEWPWANQTRYLAFIYKTKEFQGELKDSEEGHLFWIPKENLTQYVLSQDMEEIVRIADSRPY